MTRGRDASDGARSAEGSEARLRGLHAAIVLSVFLLDQATKLWALAALEGEAVEVLPRCFHLVLTHNRGGAFGLGNALPPGLRTFVFTAVPALILVALAAYSLLSSARSHLLQTSLALIIGGALGNFADRVRLGYVVDFIVWHWDELQWPSFNIADSFISVGIAMLLFQVWREGRAEDRVAAPLARSSPAEK